MLVGKKRISSMHILYIHQYFCPPGGSGNNRSLELAQAWVAAGHRVTMVTLTAYFPESLKFTEAHRKLNCAGIEVIALNVAYAHLMGFGQRVRAFLQFYRRAGAVCKRLPKPDIIYASSTPPTVGELGRRLSSRWQVPYVFETVDVWPDVPIGMGLLRNGLLARWLDRRTNKIYAAAAAIVALSDGMKDQILRHGVSPSKVHVCYNGTNLQAFAYVARAARAHTHVIYTGTVGRANGAAVIAHACKRLQILGRDDIHFTILGGGNDLENVQRLAADLLVTNLKFVPTVPKEQVADFLASADIGVVTFALFPVLEANSANKFYDYLASGLPVVINYQGWQARYLESYACGLSSDMGDLDGLVDNLLRLADDPQGRQEMGARGRQLAEEKFDRAQIAAAILDLMQSVLHPSD